MIFYKIKRSFLIIEVLLGFFLLGIFIAIFQNIPKQTFSPLIEKALEIKFHHLGDEAFYQFLKSAQKESLPKQKEQILQLDLDPVEIKIPFLFKGTCKKSLSITLKEIKLGQNKENTLLYSCNFEFSVKIGQHHLMKLINYNFISQQDCN